MSAVSCPRSTGHETAPPERTGNADSGKKTKKEIKFYYVLHKFVCIDEMRGRFPLKSAYLQEGSFKIK